MLLSIADLSQVPPGGTVATAVAGSVELAVRAEALGYQRFWLAEHHGMGHAIAGSAPEVLIARIAAATERLRVGSGGVLLNYTAPLRVAEAFTVLAALYPGRIDLGIGRADAVPPVHEALVASPEVNDDPGPPDLTPFGGMLAAFAHEDRVTQLESWLAGGTDSAVLGGSPAGPVSVGTLAAPAPGPERWLLGSSPSSALLAARLGLRYCFAAFINPTDAKLALDAYRRSFRPVPGGPPEPRTMLAVHLCCAPTDEEADRLRASVELFYGEDQPPGTLRRPLLAPAAAVARLGAVPAPTRMEDGARRRHLSGGPERARDLLEHLATETGADEITVQDLIAWPADRLRSYELLAGAFALVPSRA